ncbi:MAG: HupE/UreJ family protein, partial [Rhodoglobus sp.]
IVAENLHLQVNGEDLSIIGTGLALPSESFASTFAETEYVGLAFASAAIPEPISEIAVGWEFTSPTGDMVVSSTEWAMLGHLGSDQSATFTLDAWSTARSFALQGLDHIWSGLDHLLFLVVLTLGVVRAQLTKTAFWRVIKLVLAFTVGHAVSLVLSYFGLVTVPAAIVEPAIALSIVGAAALALRRKGGVHRWWIAGAIGLIHGLGFASSLADLGLVTQDHAIALLTFNLGIDAAQTAVVIVVMGVYALVARFLPRYVNVVRIVACIAIGVTGLVWTVTRIIAG